MAKTREMEFDKSKNLSKREQSDALQEIKFPSALFLGK